ncbi:hypothetical protein XENOCAPTIV_021288 [Xenoophorus captivus]|uniref:AB hydrolase-1 domain-containing protein n=1 Tax=Xenoophorus captivus TaxID=1517983 RepID=A0ABV0Q5Q3_9TELE
MQDGATATFDLFEPLKDHQTGDDITMVICPGIGNHSEKHYIRTFVDYAQKDGYRCAVLNHLGALPNIELTSPRMFTYGCTWEFAAMVGYIKRTYLQTQLVVVGFSLGGNIVCKKLHGHSSLKEYYEKESCVHYIHNVDVPLLLVNSADDPLVHDSLLAIPRTLAENSNVLVLCRPTAKKPNVIFALTLHGGHLGFFEGDVLFPQPLTWMDKVIVGFANTMCQWEKQKPPCQSGLLTGSSCIEAKA